MMMIGSRDKQVIDFIQKSGECSSKEIFDGVELSLSYATLKRLLKERETAAGKTKEEAIMLLNHKDALDFIIETPDYLNTLSV